MTQAEYELYQKNTVVKPEEIRLFEETNCCSVYINDMDMGLGKLYIVTWSASGSGRIISKTWNLPKRKPIDLNYIKEKYNVLVSRETTYENLRSTFEKLDITGDIYYTSFGFSYVMLFKSEKKYKEDTSKLSTKLIELGIEFTTEFSDAFWVRRFKISKKKENIEKINAL